MSLRKNSFVIKLVSPLFPLLYYFKFKKLVQALDACFDKKPDIFFFWPAYHMGGAEKVHLEIMKVAADKKIASFICYKSASDVLKAEFINASDCFVDFYTLGNYPYFQRRLVAFFQKRLNTIHYPITIFSCNVSLYYDIIDKLDNSAIRKIDLIHAFSPYTNGIENRSLDSISNLDTRVVINERTKSDLSEQYREHNIPHSELNKVSIIYNPLTISCPFLNKTYTAPYRCLWVARGSVEKRPHLYIKIAREAAKRNLPFIFSMVGNVSGMIPEDAAKFVKLFGQVHNSNELNTIYQEHDILITTSVYEGFPLTITEAICNGLLNISTDVGGIPEHIQNEHTGLLVENSENEDLVVQEFIQKLITVSENPSQFYRIYKQAYEHIHTTFSYESFK